nr:hypothetical protein [Nitrospirota bacterium]
MRCPRCRGLMVVDHFTDMQFGGGPLWLRAWRCVSCGEVIEPGMAQRRLAHGSCVTRFVQRLTRRPSRITESVPLGV